ncbi:MAG: energy-coupling factor transporter ATPase [Acutalibacteraceae bacterium]|nr:energy-coupling factor transporter ATPase [Acutalibacteraceae bacterium]
MAILEVKNLTHTYSGNTPFINDAVSDVSFMINKGEIIGIIGHTGSGKSTLVQHLNGLLQPTMGKVLFENVDIWENPKEIRKIRSKVGLVFQYPEYQLFEETVFKDIAFGPSNMGLSGEELKETVLETCKIVGVKPEFLEKSPFDLSGGEKRRVAIAGVMAMKPQVIVFDEPTAGLDPKGREDVANIIQNYRKATDATVIIISHSMEDMAEVADKILVMNEGKLAFFDTPKEVFGKEQELSDMGLNVPIVTRVFGELEKMGINIPYKPLTVSEAVKLLESMKGGNE